MCLKDTVARTEARDAHKALQNITTSTNALRCPSLGKKTSTGTQKTTAQGSEADSGLLILKLKRRQNSTNRLLKFFVE